MAILTDPLGAPSSVNNTKAKEFKRREGCRGDVDLATPFGCLAFLARKPDPGDRNPYLAKSPHPRPLVMAVAAADDQKTGVVFHRLAPPSGEETASGFHD
jgi:hypothetical protein